MTFSQYTLDNIAALYKELLVLLGENSQSEGLLRTPERVARFWDEFLFYDPGDLDVTFEAISTDQMVVVAGIRVWSLCEHHLLPFSCDISIGYITQQKVLGLSKFARIAHKHAHKLQLQERLVHEIADEIEELVESEDVAVLGVGEHLCMTMRGVRTPGRMVTSVMRGIFRQELGVRQEFLSLVEASLAR